MYYYSGRVYDRTLGKQNWRWSSSSPRGVAWDAAAAAAAVDELSSVTPNCEKIVLFAMIGKFCYSTARENSPDVVRVFCFFLAGNVLRIFLPCVFPPRHIYGRGLENWNFDLQFPFWLTCWTTYSTTLNVTGFRWCERALAAWGRGVSTAATGRVQGKNTLSMRIFERSCFARILLAGLSCEIRLSISKFE